MAKLTVQDVEKIDVDAILKRMSDVAKLDGGIADLAKYLSLSPQALRQSSERKSISLALLLKVRARTGVSLDYLVFGDEKQKVLATATESDEYMDVEMLVGGATVKVLRKLLPPDVDPTSLRAYLRKDNNLYIIDITDQAIERGLIAFGRPESPVIRRCTEDLSGFIVSDGQAIYGSEGAIVDLKVVGRVILQMTQAIMY